MGLLTAATGAAAIAMGLSAGWIMDRFDRRQPARQVVTYPPAHRLVTAERPFVAA
jgi:hypothetical protein